MSTGRPGARSEGVLNGAAREALIYGLLLSAAVLIYLLIRAYGQRLPSPTRAAAQLGPVGGPPGGHDADVMVHILVALAVVIAFARLGGMLFRFLDRQSV